MKCPFRTITAIERLSTKEGKVQAEKYADCYGCECMAFRNEVDPMTKVMTVGCERMRRERK